MVTFGIDANVLTRKKRTGTERYVFELLSRMKKIPLTQNEEVILYASKALTELDPLPEGWRVEILDWKLPMKGWTHGRLSWELLRRTPNVFFSPAHEIPMFHGDTKIVSTVHDVAFRRLENIYPSKGRLRQEWAIHRAIGHTDRIIVISDATKQDLIELYNVPEEKMTKIYLSVDQAQFKTSESEFDRVRHLYDLRHPYFISIGRIEKKKNILFLIDAFDAFKKMTSSHYQLVLGGSFGFGGDAIKERISRSPYSSSIRVLGYVPEGDLAPLMGAASAYVFPSHYEGFGIPALEAMAASTPLIASDIPALREVAADAALFASPTNISAWAEAMKRISTEFDLVDSLLEKARERLNEFDWDRTAEKTLEVLRCVWSQSLRD